MGFLSAFLSHTSKDKPLVEQVGSALGARGIVPWLDVGELYPGLSLSEALPRAIDGQTVVVAFLSYAALESEWVFRELEHALGAGDPALRERVVPVFLDEPKVLVKAHDLLRGLWLDASGRHVDRLGIVGRDPQHIADGIARRLHASLPAGGPLYVGLQTRGGRPDLPAGGAGALLFRPDGLVRDYPKGHLLEGTAWQAFADAVAGTLTRVAGGRSPGRAVHLFGHAQLALPYLVGRHFDRSTAVHLHAHGRDGRAFAVDLEPLLAPLDGGDPDRVRTDGAWVPPLPDAPLGEVSLLLMRPDGLDGFDDYRRARPDVPPPVWIETGIVGTSDELLTLVRDVTALLMHLRRDPWRVRSVRLFTQLPFHAVPFVAALLTHVADVTFMEHRPGAPADGLYVPLALPPR